MNYTERNKLIDALCGIGLMLLLTEVFYAIVHTAYTSYSHNLSNVTLGIQISGAVFLALAIFIFIRAYRKEDTTLMVYGIEFFVLAVLSALLPGAYISFPKPFSYLAKGFPYFFLMYYLIKFVVVIIISRKKKGQ